MNNDSEKKTLYSTAQNAVKKADERTSSSLPREHKCPSVYPVAQPGGEAAGSQPVKRKRKRE